MPRQPSKYTQTDVSRVLKAMSKNGLKARVDIMPDGRISILPMDSAPLAETGAAQDASIVAGERIAKMREGNDA